MTSLFQLLNWENFMEKIGEIFLNVFSVENIRAGVQLLNIYDILFWKLYFLKIWPIFVGSVHNFGRSDLLNWKKNKFTRCLCRFMPNLQKKMKWNLMVTFLASARAKFWQWMLIRVCKYLHTCTVKVLSSYKIPFKM